MFSFRSSKHVSFSFLKTCFLFGPQNMFSFSVLKTCFPFRSSKHVSFSFLKTGFLFGPQNRFPFRSSKQVSFSFLKTDFLFRQTPAVRFRERRAVWSSGPLRRAGLRSPTSRRAARCFLCDTRAGSPRRVMRRVRLRWLLYRIPSRAAVALLACSSRSVQSR